jgi:hypothetical protein
MNALLDDLGLKRYLPAAWTKRGPVIPVLRFSGAIGVVTPLRPGLSLSTCAAAIEKAFTMSGAKAVAIQINSPGGSAVQSTLIYKRIRALADEKNLKVYVFAEVKSPATLGFSAMTRVLPGPEATGAFAVFLAGLPSGPPAVFFTAGFFMTFLTTLCTGVPAIRNTSPRRPPGPRKTRPGFRPG